jgi:endonuclease/exonuclease/phosphatase family metal-dependent hydrolase
MKARKSIKKHLKKSQKNKSKKRHLKYHKRIKSKIGGNDDKLTVMTFNVEVFLELYHYNKDTNNVIAIEDKITRFGTLFENIDIACLQETVSTDARAVEDPIKLLKEVSICKSHPLTWPKSKALYGEKSYLSNSVYVKPEYISEITIPSDTKINIIGDQRCYASTTMTFKGRLIQIASVHIIGGRFDDKKALENDDNLNEKISQIKALIASGADIICGDFNTKLRVSETDDYFESLFSELGASSELRETYKNRWDNWIYMDMYHDFLTSAGYKSVYYLDDGTIIPSIGDTSAFGGIVDMIYYKSTSLKLDGLPEIVGRGVVMGDPSSYYKHTPILSDHYPVKASFTLVE